MAITHPELRKEYQGDANLMIAGTNKKLDWICSTCEHMWSAVGNSRVKGKGCPACAGRLHSDGRNSMYNTHPHLAKEYQGNANLIIAGTNDRLPWKCITCEHEWTSLGEGRIQGNGCPACAKTGYDPSKIGYVYIHTYIDDTTNWLKCGITNHPIDRFKKLSRAAKSQGIEVLELDIFKFDDGYVAQQCETALLRMKRIRYDSGYDVDGKSEFFQFDALDKIKNIINKY
jgi:rubrerythrin